MTTVTEWYTSPDLPKLWKSCTFWSVSGTGRSHRWRISPRRARLFAVACCKQAEVLWRPIGSKETLAVAELYADGKVDRERLIMVKADADHAVTIYGARFCRALSYCVSSDEMLPVDIPILCLCLDTGGSQTWDGDRVPFSTQANILRDVIDPFAQRTSCKPCKGDGYLLDNNRRALCPLCVGRWATPTILALAHDIYEGEWSSLPVLHDALLDAGCDSEAILNHLLKPDALHAKGCWVLDLLLCRD